MDLKLWICEVEIVNPWSWNRQFMKLKSCICVVEIVKLWNSDFKMKLGIHEVEMSQSVFRTTLWVSVELGITEASWKWRDNNFYSAYPNGLIGASQKCKHLQFDFRILVDKVLQRCIFFSQFTTSYVRQTITTTIMTPQTSTYNKAPFTYRVARESIM
jgi:hypothetical protein